MDQTDRSDDREGRTLFIILALLLLLTLGYCSSPWVRQRATDISKAECGKPETTGDCPTQKPNPAVQAIADLEAVSKTLSDLCGAGDATSRKLTLALEQLGKHQAQLRQWEPFLANLAERWPAMAHAVEQHTASPAATPGPFGTPAPSKDTHATPASDPKQTAEQVCRDAATVMASSGEQRAGAMKELESAFAALNDFLDKPKTVAPMPPALETALTGFPMSVDYFTAAATMIDGTSKELSAATYGLRSLRNIATNIERLQKKFATMRQAALAACAGAKDQSLCRRLSAMVVDPACLERLKAAIEKLAPQLDAANEHLEPLVKAKEPLEKTLAEISTHVTRDDEGHWKVPTGETRKAREAEAAFDRALECRERAYAVRACAPETFKRYGADGCPNELGMAGIWWQGRYAGDDGYQLRWFFRTTTGADGSPPLGFPSGGFNIYRRTHGTYGWQLLNTEGAIKPVTTWSGTAPAGVWKPRGVDRLPAQAHALYTGAKKDQFDDLLKALSYPPYTQVHYVEGRNPPEPFLTTADRDAYLSSLPDTVPGPVTWSVQPMTLLATMSMHPEVARLEGLYYIDKSAPAIVAQDYLVQGTWPTRQRYYLLRGISGPGTLPLTPPVMSANADVVHIPPQLMANNTVWPTEAAVRVKWVPPTSTPDEPILDPNEINPVMYTVERSDYGLASAAPSANGTAFTRIKSVDDNGALADASPVVLSPEKKADGTLVWPDYFAFDKYVEYKHYHFRAIARDFFGRDSVPSNEIPVKVEDRYAPLAPLNAKAMIYQRQDQSILRPDATTYDALFPQNSTHNYVIKVTWFWPDEYHKQYPDIDSFRVLYKFGNLDAFPAANWPVASTWDGWTSDNDPRLATSVTQFTTVKPTEYKGVSLPPGRFYSFVSYVNGTDAITPALLQQINADDVQPTVNGYVTVAAVDAPAGNVGSTSGPVPVFTRDLTPPNAPDAPQKVMQSRELDQRGNVTLSLRVNGASNIFGYHIYRVSKDALHANSTADALPTSCVADQTNGAEQRDAYKHGKLYSQITGKPLSATSAGGALHVDFTDNVDGTVSQTFFYAARAVDPAGNESALSCPSVGILILDAMAPRAPVISAVNAMESEQSICLRWTRNTEPDLDHYNVFGTTNVDSLITKRKLNLLLTADKAGVASAPAGAPNGTIVSSTNYCAGTPPTTAGQPKDWIEWKDTNLKPGTAYYYRIDAVDTSGNISQMSPPVSARPIRTAPPAPPLWDTTSPITDSTDGDGKRTVALKWQLVPNDPDVQFQIQKKLSAMPGWVPVGGWLPPGTTTTLDERVNASGDYEYRVRAMSREGLKSVWSTSQRAVDGE